MPQKILLIEDDPIIAADLEEKLTTLGYNVVGSTDDKKEVLKLVEEAQPDLILADIILEGREYDGIDLVNEIFTFHKAPVIYLTANSEAVTVKKATTSQPAAFLLKPFRISEISINIDLAIESFKEKYSFDAVNEMMDDSIFIPNNSAYTRLDKSDILYIEADGSYTKIYTTEKIYSMTLNLKHFMRQLGDANFIRVSRKHLVNMTHIVRIEGRTLYLYNGTGITMSKSKTQEILDRFPILRTR